MSITEKNHAILRDYYNLDPGNLGSSVENKSYTVETTRRGFKTVSVNGKYIHSRYDPVSEAEKIIKMSADSSSDCWVFGGFGLGYYIEAFLKYTETVKAVVVEPDPELFRIAADEIDLSGMLMSGRIILLIGAESSSVIPTLNMFQFEKIKYFQIRSEYELNTDYFEKLKDSVASYISRKDVNNNTLIRFGKLWVKNLLFNLPVFANSPGIDSIKERFKGLPALILAGGPGLDKSLENLKSYREKCLIIAVDTSLSAALRYGVEPDFLVVVDPQYWNFRHLDRCSLKNTIVVSEPSTYPHTFRNPEADYIFASSVFPLGQKIEKETYRRGKIGAGGSVSTTAWDFARIAGCSPVVFAGLDLSYPEKQTHFKGSFFEERSHTLSGRTMTAAHMDYKLLTDASLIEAESNSGGSVFTDRRLVIYRQWFEEQQKQHNVKTLTLSKSGIKIEGITLTDHDYINNLPDIRRSLDDKISDTLEEIKTDLTDRGKYIEICEKTASSLDKLKSVSVRGLEICRMLLESGRYNEQAADELNRIDNEILSGESRDTAGFLLQEVSRKILTSEKETDFKKVIGNSLSIYDNLIKSSDYHIKLIKKAVKMLSEG